MSRKKAAADDGAATPESPAPTPPEWQAVPAAKANRVVNNTVLTIALVMLAAACVTAFVSVLRIADIWFESRFVPIAQLVVAGLVIAVCVAVVRRVKS